jgi:hypothetical protein
VPPKKLEPKKPKYVPTVQERRALDRYGSRLATRTAPRVKLAKGGKAIALDHSDESVGSMLLMEALGTADPDFINGLLTQLTRLSWRNGQVDEVEINFMLSVVKGIEPRDQIEAMLAAQMAGVHSATMRLARRLADAEFLEHQDSAERAFNKLTRTFASQIEALKRYRNGGEQKVTVQHVSVSEGGQAIVGNVTQGLREAAPDKATTSSLALADARMAPMPIPRKSKRTEVSLRDRSKT